MYVNRRKLQNTLDDLPVIAAELVGKFYFRRLEAAAYADTSTDDCQTAYREFLTSAACSKETSARNLGEFCCKERITKNSVKTYGTPGV